MTYVCCILYCMSYSYIWYWCISCTSVYNSVYNTDVYCRWYWQWHTVTDFFITPKRWVYWRPNYQSYWPKSKLRSIDLIVWPPVSSSFWGYEREAPFLCNLKFDQKLPSVNLWLASFLKRAEMKSFAFLSNRSGKIGSFIKIPMKTSSWLFPTNGSWPTKTFRLIVLTQTLIFNKKTNLAFGKQVFRSSTSREGRNSLKIYFYQNNYTLLWFQNFLHEFSLWEKLTFEMFFYLRSLKWKSILPFSVIISGGTLLGDPSIPCKISPFRTIRDEPKSVMRTWPDWVSRIFSPKMSKLNALDIEQSVNFGNNFWNLPLRSLWRIFFEWRYLRPLAISKLYRLAVAQSKGPISMYAASSPPGHSSRIIELVSY